MPETVILNENISWDDDIQDAIGPDYGFPRERASSRIFVKPPGGRPYSRETQNVGSSFQLSWLNRSFACVQRVKHFVEQYEDGYFTIIDQDGGGRHYVGRFTGKFSITQLGNDRYDIRDLTFEEVPGVPMLHYPDDWANDSIALCAANDFGDQLLSTSGIWSAGVAAPYNTLNSTGVAGDFATMEYRGFGYQVWLQQGPDYGQVQVLLDNMLIDTVDLYAAAAAGPQPVSINVNVPLGLHRVKVLAMGSKDSAATAAAVSWCKLQVMDEGATLLEQNSRPLRCLVVERTADRPYCSGYPCRWARRHLLR